LLAKLLIIVGLNSFSSEEILEVEFQNQISSLLSDACLICSPMHP
jgi:hypothetical protein